jgi:adenylate kinase family enzyme
MQSKRILVLGCCGSGKSTFARRLGDLTGIPVVHLDKLFWKPGWVQSTREEFYPVIEDALRADEWIMDGNYSGSLSLRLGRCDQVFWFGLPRLICLWGVMSRFLKNRGKQRPDMGSACPEKIDWEFIKYTWNFEKNQGANNRRLVRESGKPVVTFRSRREAKRYLEGETRSVNT